MFRYQITFTCIQKSWIKQVSFSTHFKWNIFIYGDGSHNEELERASDNDHLHGVHRVEHLDHTGVGCHHDPGDEG